jgi:hypothetical protein
VTGRAIAAVVGRHFVAFAGDVLAGLVAVILAPARFARWARDRSIWWHQGVQVLVVGAGAWWEVTYGSGLIGAGVLVAVATVVAFDAGAEGRRIGQRSHGLIMLPGRGWRNR